MSKDLEDEQTPEMKKDRARRREQYQIAIRNGSIRVEYEPGHRPKAHAIRELVLSRIERERLEKAMNGPLLTSLIQ